MNSNLARPVFEQSRRTPDRLVLKAPPALGLRLAGAIGGEGIVMLLVNRTE